MKWKWKRVKCYHDGWCVSIMPYEGSSCHSYSNDNVLFGRGGILWYYVPWISALDIDVWWSFSLSFNIHRRTSNDIHRRKRLYGSTGFHVVMFGMSHNRCYKTKGVQSMESSSRRKDILRSLYDYNVYFDLHMADSLGIFSYHNIPIYNILETVFETEKCRLIDMHRFYPIRLHVPIFC